MQSDIGVGRTDAGDRRVRPAFVVALGVVVIGVVVAASFVLGQRTGRLSLTDADRSHLARAYELGQQRPSVMLVLESDDERTTLAHFAQQTTASDLSAYSTALLVAAGEDPPSGRARNGVFEQSGSTSLTQAEREQAFLSECASWAEQVAQLTSRQQLAALSSRLRPMLEVVADHAREVGDLCTQQ